MSRTAVKGYLVSRAIAFVPHPQVHGVWIKTHSCVLQVACPRCGSKVAEPCTGLLPRHPAGDHTRMGPHGKYVSQVCQDRQSAARGMPLQIPPIEVDLRDLPQPLVAGVPCGTCRGERCLQNNDGEWVECPACNAEVAARPDTSNAGGTEGSLG